MKFLSIFVAIPLLCQIFASTNDSIFVSKDIQQLHITNIYYSGNNSSRAKSIQMALGLDTGMIFDSNRIEEARKRLLYINMFSRVDIVPKVNSKGVDLYVSVKEPFYLTFGGNIDYYSYCYGKQGLWCAPRLGYEDANFRGKFEDLKFIFRLSGLQLQGQSLEDYFNHSSLQWLPWQSGYLSWNKPLLPTYFFLWTAFTYDHKPDELRQFNKTEISARLSVGKRLRGRSNITVSLIPDLQTRTLLGSLNTDSTRVFQMFGALSYSNDKKDPFFDPDKGWALSTEIRSNYLYHQSPQKPYVQYMLDTRYYYPGFFPAEKFAFKMLTILRTDDAGSFNRLFLGGTTTIRGYNLNEIGLNTIGNDIYFLSGEYRFFLWNLPKIYFQIPHVIGKVVSYATEFDLRLDCALVADYGAVATNFHDLVNHNGPSRQSGTALGLSVRLLEIPLRGRVNFDVVWNTRPNIQYTDFYTAPSLNLNMDINY